MERELDFNTVFDDFELATEDFERLMVYDDILTKNDSDSNDLNRAVHIGLESIGVNQGIDFPELSLEKSSIMSNIKDVLMKIITAIKYLFKIVFEELTKTIKLIISLSGLIKPNLKKQKERVENYIKNDYVRKNEDNINNKSIATFFANGETRADEKSIVGIITLNSKLMRTAIEILKGMRNFVKKMKSHIKDIKDFGNPDNKKTMVKLYTDLIKEVDSNLSSFKMTGNDDDVKTEPMGEGFRLTYSKSSGKIRSTTTNTHEHEEIPAPDNLKDIRDILDSVYRLNLDKVVGELMKLDTNKIQGEIYFMLEKMEYKIRKIKDITDDEKNSVKELFKEMQKELNSVGRSMATFYAKVPKHCSKTVKHATKYCELSLDQYEPA